MTSIWIQEPIQLLIKKLLGPWKLSYLVHQNNYADVPNTNISCNLTVMILLLETTTCCLQTKSSSKQRTMFSSQVKLHFWSCFNQLHQKNHTAQSFTLHFSDFHSFIHLDTPVLGYYNYIIAVAPAPIWPNWCCLSCGQN